MRSVAPRSFARSPRLLGGAVAAVITLLAAATAAAEFVWVGGSSQDWFDVANWEEEGQTPDFAPGCDNNLGVDVLVPSNAGSVLVKCNGGGNVAIGALESQAPLEIAVQLTLDGDSCLFNPYSTNFFGLVVNALLTLEGDEILWDRGVIEGTGFVTNFGTLTLGGNGNRTLRVDLTNRGIVEQTTGLLLQSGQAVDDARVFNRSLWRGYGTISRGSGADSAFIVAEGGTIRHPGTPKGQPEQTLRFAVPLEIDGDGGLIDAEAGDIRISAGGTHAGPGAYTASFDAEILFDKLPGTTPVEIADTYTGSGFGNIRLGGELVVGAGGSLTPAMAEDATNGFFLDNNADLTVVGDFTNQGKMTWRAGTVHTLAGGTASNGSDGTLWLTHTGNSTPTVDGICSNLGVWRHETGDCLVPKGGLLRCADGGTFELRSGRVIGAGAFEVAGGLLLRPIDAGDGFGEILATTTLDSAQVIGEAGEIRLAGGGTIESTSFEAQSDSRISFRSGAWTVGGSDNSFSGAGEIDIRNGATVAISSIQTNQLGEFGGPGLMRLGTDGTGGTLLATTPNDGGRSDSLTGPSFNNVGNFRWRSGVIGDAATMVFVNSGDVRTEGSGLQLHAYYFQVGGLTMIDHGTQAHQNITVQAGEVQQSSSLALASPAATLSISGGTRTLNGAATISGTSEMFLDAGGLLRKWGAGSTATVAVPLSRLGGTGRVAVEAGTLVLAETDGEAGTNWSIAPGAQLVIGSKVFQTGQNPELGLIDELEGVVSLAAGPTEPPRLVTNQLIHNGRVRPGGADGTGILNIAADVSIGSAGILSVNIAGPPESEDHDRLDVEGALVVGGTLRIDLLDGYEPVLAQSFVVATATQGITGSFDAIVGNGEWSVAIVGNTLHATCTGLPTCTADITGRDGIVDGADLGALLSAWGFTPSNPADLDGNDFVDGSDLGLLLGSWGACAE